MSRYRVAMVAACPFPAARGTPARILRLSEALARRGHDVDVITYHLGSKTGPLDFRIFRIANVKTYQKESAGPSWQKLLVLDPLLAVKCLQVVRQQDYDVIHAHHAEGLLAAWPAARALGLPLIFDAHTLLATELPFYRMGLTRRTLSRVGQSLDARLPRLSRHVIAVSERIRVELVERWGVDPCKVSLVPNGVEDAMFPAVAVCPTAEPTLVYAGNMASYQGIDLMLAGFAVAAREFPGLRMKILTSESFGPYEDIARSLGIRDSLDVRQCSLEQLPMELAAAHAAVNPRTACDGLPQKLLNYMAAACPIVSFAGSARHLVQGENALIVPDGDVAALSAAMLRLVRERGLAQALGRSAQRHVRSHMTWQHAAASVEDVYARVTEDAR
jgi:glycosyltransferase involved in cell wall biosynthesis